MRLAAFTGRWRIERRIADALDVGSGSFTGEARFLRCGEGLDYVEQGALRLASGAAFPATRRLRWQETAGEIQVHFDGGGFFHAFACAEYQPEAEHACPPDHYRVRYDFTAWPRWTITWSVVGPRKDYAMASVYLPLDSAAEIRQET